MSAESSPATKILLLCWQRTSQRLYTLQGYTLHLTSMSSLQWSPSAAKVVYMQEKLTFWTILYQAWSNPCMFHVERTDLYQTDPWTNIDKQIWKNCIRVSYLEPVFWTTMTLVNKCFIWNVFKKKIASFDQTLQLIFFVNSETPQTNTV